MIAKGFTATVTAVLLLFSVGGCKVINGKEQEPPVERVFDLSQPPSRADVGLPTGKADVTYQRKDHKPFPVKVILPDGKQLALEARLVGFDSRAAVDPKIEAPTTMDIHHYAAGLEAGRDRLLATATEFGLDQAAVNDWYTRAKAPNKLDPVTKTPWLRAKVGYLTLEAQGRYSPPVPGGAADQTIIHLVLAWG